jgi:DNA invertase Pin-like site-specific DNA recombinase
MSDFFYSRVSISSVQGIDIPKNPKFKATYSDKTDVKKFSNPEFKKLLNELKNGDTVYINQLSDLGNSVQSLLLAVIELAKANVSLHSVKEKIVIKVNVFEDFLSLINAIVDLEIRNDQERTEEINHRKAQHARTSAVMKGDKLQRARDIANEHWNGGLSVNELAKKHNLTPPTIYRYLEKFPREC